MLDFREMLRLYYDVHLSYRDIARALKTHHSTVSRCLARFETAGGTWPLANTVTDHDLQRWMHPQPLGRPRTRPEPDWPRIHADLRRYRQLTLQQVWSEYKEAHPEGYQYSQFVTRYRNYVKSVDVVYRKRYHPADQMQVDFAGDTLPIYDRRGRVIQRAAVFVAVLPYSSYTFVGVYPDQTLASWIRGHVEAFTAFGGVPRMVVPDNPKPLVIDVRGDVVLHPTYQDLGRHYQCGLVPGRPRKPRDKAQAENHVLIVERWILMALRHVHCQSLGEAQERVAALVERVNQRPFQKLPGTRHTRWREEERPALRPLPPQPYVLAEFRQARVGPDYHVHVDHGAYSVPYTLVGETVTVRLTAATVECFVDHQRVASHPRATRRGTWSTRHEHMPPHHQAMAKGWSPDHFLRWAADIGPHTRDLIAAILAAGPIPEQHYTRCRGILGLAKTHTPAVLERAAERALHAEVQTVKAVKIFCEAVAAEPAPPRRRAAHGNTRGPAYYAAESPTRPASQGE